MTTPLLFLALVPLPTQLPTTSILCLRMIVPPSTIFPLPSLHPHLLPVSLYFYGPSVPLRNLLLHSISTTLSDKSFSGTSEFNPETRLRACITDYRFDDVILILAPHIDSNERRDSITRAPTVRLYAPCHEHNDIQTGCIQHWYILVYSNVKQYRFTEDTKQSRIPLEYPTLFRVQSTEGRMHLCFKLIV